MSQPVNVEAERESKWNYKPLTSGARVDFIYYDDLGNVDITINPDGSYELHGPVDPNANYFSQQYSPDTMEHRLAEFAKNFAGSTKSERITMWTGYWSQRNVVLSLSIEGDRTTFEEAGTA